MAELPGHVPNNTADLRRLVYAESELNAYNHLESSVNADHFKLYDNRSESHETNSMISGRTSNYSATDIQQPKYDKIDNTNIKKPANIRTKIHLKQTSQDIDLPSHLRMDSNFTNLSTTSIRTIESTTKLNPDAFEKQDPQEKRLYGSTLAKTLHERRIRESVEMDPLASMQSSGVVSYPSARLSHIAKQSVITLRMMHGTKQIRLKLYLPLTGNKRDNNPPQIIIIFVNKGATMLSVKRFLEDHYPNKVLKGKIRTLCVADDDGDIDDDFPPIPDTRDITSLGVSNFWVDRIFEKENMGSGVLYSEEEISFGTRQSKYTETKNNDSYYSEVEDKRCCWCCWLRTDDDEEEDDDEAKYTLSYTVSDYQNLVLNVNQSKSKESNYTPPNITNGNNEKPNVQYANL